MFKSRADLHHNPGNNHSYDVYRCLTHGLPLEWLTLADLLV